MLEYDDPPEGKFCKDEIEKLCIFVKYEDKVITTLKETEDLKNRTKEYISDINVETSNYYEKVTCNTILYYDKLVIDFMAIKHLKPIEIATGEFKNEIIKFYKKVFKQLKANC